MAWSSSARLAALHSHSSFALPNDSTKQSNALRAEESDLRHVRMAVTTDFARTIALAELMQADRVTKQSKQPMRSTMNRTQQQLQPVLSATTPSPLSQSAQLPARVPPAQGYSAALAHMHAVRADRLVRMPRGWSQGEALAKQARRDEHNRERIDVFQPEVRDEIVIDGLDAQAAAERSRRAQSAPHRNSMGHGDSVDAAVRAADRAAQNSAKQQQFWADVQEQKERLAKRLSERMALRRARDDAAFETMLARLDDNKDLLVDIEQYLSIGEQEGERRKERLYQQWCAQVYEPMQSAIAAGLAARPTADVEARRVRMFNDFLRASNRKKEGLHLDVLVEPGYFPLESRRHVLRVHTGKLSDPLKASLQSADEEFKLQQVFDPSAQRIAHQPKASMLPAPVWAKVTATPHGRYSLLKGNVVPALGKKLVEPDARLRDPHCVRESFDHYNVDTDPATVRAQFFRRGKRVEGYDNASERVDYNIVASTEPSIKTQYAAMHAHQQQQTVNAQATQRHAHFAPTPPARFVETQLEQQ